MVSRSWPGASIVAVAASILVGIAAVAVLTAQSDELTLRIIVVDSVDEARRVVDRLQRGEDFATLARTLSIDPTGYTGGLLGRTRLSALRAELRTALRGLGAGQISPIAQIPTGFAILAVVPPDEAGGSAGPEYPVAGPALAATGAVKYVADVAGFGEALVAMRQFDRPPDWELDPQMVCRLRKESLAASREAVERDLAARAFETTADPSVTGQVQVMLSQLHAFDGRMSQAIDRLRDAYAVASKRGLVTRPSLEEALGIAHLHKAGMDNGLQFAPGDRCLLPMKPEQALAQTADLEKAIGYFSTFLARRPDDLEVRWLFNLAHMSAGGYPDKVPASLLIPPATFESSEDVGRFLDVAPRAGLVSIGQAGGVIVDDFDNDGRLDVVTSSMGTCDRMQFFHRTERGLFTEQASTRGLANQLGGLNMMQADFDNDGYLDILVLRGGWEFPQRKSLLRNNGDGTFTDVTVASGLATPASSTQTAVWTDIDQDGFLDLFVGNEDRPPQLFLNKQNGTFEDIAGQARLTGAMMTKGVAAGDYDNDGWPDLYLSNLGGPNSLFRNNHDRTFTPVGGTAGTAGSGRGFATWFFDYDNDGWQDLFSTSYFTSVDETARTYLGLPHNARTLMLYRNRGDGTFADVTVEVGLDKVFMPMGANFGDIDNDGYLDIYLGTGNPSYASLVPSVLLRNREGKAFVDVTGSSGTGELHRGHGVAFADLDGDGDEEIVFEVGGATHGDRHPLRLFENPGHGNDWLSLKLVGVKTNRAAVGARITVTVQDGAGRKRSIHRTVGSGGSFGASPLEQHIGLGRSARAVSVDIWWPTSDTRQHFANVAVNQALQVTELASDYVRIRRPSLPLGGADSRGTTAVR